MLSSDHSTRVGADFGRTRFMQDRMVELLHANAVTFPVIECVDSRALRRSESSDAVPGLLLVDLGGCI